jgi:DNA repair protein RecO (recombination protein O)
MGRIQAKSRGSRKITSQKGSHLDILNFCQFQFYKNGNNLLLTECRVENAFQNLKNDLDKSLFALSAAEIIIKSLQNEQENQELFHLFKNYLERLENHPFPQLLLEEFKIKTLKSAGSWPDLTLCHFCQHKWTENESIYADQHGQLTCQNCLTLNPNQLQLFSFSIIKLANYLALHPTDQLKLKISAEEQFNLQKITTIFLSNYLQQELKTEKLLRPGHI